METQTSTVNYHAPRTIQKIERAKINRERTGMPRNIRRNSILKWVWKKTYYENQDCIIAVCAKGAKTGVGKTIVAGFLVEELDVSRSGKMLFPLLTKEGDPNNFEHILPTVCYGMKQLRRFWRVMARFSEKGKRTKGRPCIVEEAQVYLNSRDYHSQKNMDTLKQFVSGRAFNNIYFLTYPSYNRIDTQIRERVHLLIEVYPPLAEQGLSRWKAMILDHQGEGKPPIRRYLRAIEDGRIVRKDGFFYSPLPSKPMFELLQKKERMWKLAMRQGKVNTDGDIVTAQEQEQIKVSKMTQRERRQMEVEKKANELKPSRHQYLVWRATKMVYNVADIAKKNGIPRGWADDIFALFEKWDMEEKVDIQEIRID